MNVPPTAEQAALGDLMADVVERECGPDVVRAAWTADDSAVLDRLWSRVAATGLFAMLVSEDDGGLGLDCGYLVPALEPVGAAAVPGPVSDTVSIVAPVLAAAGHPRLPDVLAGEVRVACGLGRTGPIPHVGGAELVLLTDGDRVVLHDVAELRVTPVDAIDGALHPAEVEPVGAGDDLGPTTDRDRWIARATVATAAELVGLGERLLAMTVAYVGQREQFGVPVGSFQAVKHQLADVRVALSFARPLVVQAGWAMAHDRPDAQRAVASAKVAANDAAELAAATSLQCHGAIAYTVEHDYHLYAKRVWSLVADRGDSTHHRLAVADLLDLPMPGTTPPGGTT